MVTVNYHYDDVWQESKPVLASHHEFSLLFITWFYKSIKWPQIQEIFSQAVGSSQPTQLGEVLT
jgi:hypothetical protein